MDTRTNSPAADATERLQMYIGGQWVAGTSGQTLDSLNPYTQKVWATVPDASEADVKAAVAAAREAFDNGPWRQTTPQQRAALMRKLGDLIARDAERMARIESMDNGKLLREMLGQWKYLPEWMYYFAGQATQSQGEVLPSDRPNFIAFTRKEPIGVVAAITPWNSPCLLLMFKLAPGLAAGCTFVVKPSEHTPVSTLRFAELVEEAGFPPGVFNVVTGGRTCGAALSSHPSIAKISFTGSTATGKLVGAAAVQNMTRFSLELGGKNPIVMLDDVDVAQALDGVAAGAFFNQGQVCAAASRIYVHRSKFAQLADGLAGVAQSMKLGAGLDTTAQINPLVSAHHRDKVVEHIEGARRAGLTFLAGGTPADDLPGYYVKPAVIADPHPDSAIVHDEVFGPVIVVVPFDDAADAVRLANASPYGLAASIWSNDLKRVMNLVPQIEAGTVWVNCHIPLDPSMPFGGYKQSGIGREFGQYAIEGFTETKSVCIAH